MPISLRQVSKPDFANCPSANSKCLKLAGSEIDCLHHVNTRRYSMVVYQAIGCTAKVGGRDISYLSRIPLAVRRCEVHLLHPLAERFVVHVLLEQLGIIL